MRLRVLGCGTSSGVPRIGPDWGACDPADPRNRRTRASMLIETDRTRLLIDTSPDLREQLLAANVSDVDAVIWTHDHADHCHGIDDLRQLYHVRGRPVIGYARAATLAALEARFAYAFYGRDGYPPTVEGRALPDQILIGDIAVDAVDQPHGSITSAGLRFTASGKSIAYATDFNEMTPDMKKLYQGVDLWAVDTLRARPHPTHPHLAEVLGWIDALRPGQAVLTHMDQTLDYATLAAMLPPGVVPGHDGLVVTP